VEKAGQKLLLVAGDISTREHCEQLVDAAVEAFGRIDIVVNNAAFQMTRTSLDDISDEEFDRTVRTNLYAMFRLTKAAVPHMGPGSSIISTSSVNADQPKPFLLPYSATKAAMQNLSGGFAALLAEKGIRSNIVAPGPIWTPLIVSTMPDEQVRDFGSHTPAGRPGQPAELAAVYVMLASDEASYVSGATVAVTGGVAII
jgi:NAD(P)-dependent dehydrogenase (short-subunit alcohol dehydrogenase family)